MIGKRCVKTGKRGCCSSDLAMIKGHCWLLHSSTHAFVDAGGAPSYSSDSGGRERERVELKVVGAVWVLVFLSYSLLLFTS